MHVCNDTSTGKFGIQPCSSRLGARLGTFYIRVSHNMQPLQSTGEFVIRGTITADVVVSQVGRRTKFGRKWQKPV